MQSAEVDRQTECMKSAERVEHRGHVVGVTAERWECFDSNAGCLKAFIDCIGQHRVRADLNRQCLTGGRHTGHRVGKQHRLADVLPPVFGPHVTTVDQATGDRRKQRHAGGCRAEIGE